MVELDDATKAKVLKQVEFYFSDSNLPKDKFLRGQVDGHPEGYVDLSLIISFQRMRDVLKLGTVRPEDVPDDLVTAVADCLRASTLMQVSESGFQIKRSLPLPSAKEAARAVDSRSLYVRPFPMQASLDQIVTFFQDAGCELNAVRVRRHARSRDFKGSVFIEAASLQEAERILGLGLEFEGAPLRMEKKQAYLARKIAERKAKAMDPPGGEPLTLTILEEMDSDCEIAALTALNKSIKLPAPSADEPPAKRQKKPEAVAADDAAAEAADAKMDEAAAAGEPAAEAEPEVEQYEPGCILLLTLLGQPTEKDPYRLTKMIKEAIGPDKVRFVEQQRQQQQDTAAGADEQQQQQQQQDGEGQGEAAAEAAEQETNEQRQETEQQQQQQDGSKLYMVRFRQADQAQAVLEAYAAADAAGEPKQVAGCPAAVRHVEGQEEQDYYRRAARQRAAAAKRNEGGTRGGRSGGVVVVGAAAGVGVAGGRGGRAGRGGGRGRGGGNFRGRGRGRQ